MIFCLSVAARTIQRQSRSVHGIQFVWYISVWRHVQSNVKAGPSMRYNLYGISQCGGYVQSNVKAGPSMRYNLYGISQCGGYVQSNVKAGPSMRYNLYGISQCGGYVQSNVKAGPSMRCNLYGISVWRVRTIQRQSRSVHEIHSVCYISLAETNSLICNFYLAVAAHTFV